MTDLATTDQPAEAAPARDALFPGDSELARRCRALDWEATPLGPPEGWPAALRVVVRTCLESPFPVNLWCGPDLVLVYNDAYRRVLGAKHPDALGRPGLEVWSDIRADVEPMFARIRAGGPPVYAEDARFVMARGEGAEGEDAWITFGLSAVRDDDGAIVAFFNPATETTGQVLARRQADAARVAAEEANAAKAQFLAMMSHELRTPLNAISGYTQLLALGVHGPVTDAQADALGRIRASQEHLLGLINSVLNYAKIEAGTVRYAPADLDLPAAVAAAAALVEGQVRAAGHALELRPCAGAVARVDPEKLRQIVLNLLSNAIKFTAPGGRLVVGCAASEGGGPVRVTVADTGRGIPPDQLERVFEPFVQVGRSYSSVDAGTGLGLAISRDLARAMGGDLTVESVLGAGSTFTLTLPAGGPDAAPGRPVPRRRATDRGAPPEPPR